MTRAVAVLLALLLAAAAAGCGGEDGGADPGTATLWVTRDEGAEVLHETEVEAGRTVLEALRETAEVSTSQGGRFVQAIDGVEGSLEDGRDWFFYVNGLLADRGAAEYRLRPGDVVWWDYRRWAGEEEVNAVVGAFPEPFLHGYAGRTRATAVRYEEPDLEPAARVFALMLAADSVAPADEPVPAGSHLLLLTGGEDRFVAEATTPDAPVRFVVGGEYAERLARDPELARMRYEGLRE